MGNGSMRDALSLLDRLIAGGATIQDGQGMTVELLEQMLGLPAQQRVTALVDAIAQGDPATALEQASALLDTGIAQEQLLDVLIEWFRQLMICCACGHDSPLLELSDDARADAPEAKSALRRRGHGLHDQPMRSRPTIL